MHSMSHQTVLVSDEVASIFYCIDWIAAKNRELDFCKKDHVCMCTKGNLFQILTEMLKLQMSATVEVMDGDLNNQFSKNFGLAFDGWSKFGVHYLAVFAIRPGVPDNRFVLLGFSPFEQEGDLSAAQYAVYLEAFALLYLLIG